MEKEILILSSRPVEMKFDDGTKRNFNRVVFAFRDELAEDDLVGLNNILTVYLAEDSFAITRNIEPNEFTKARLALKKAEKNTFKYTITALDDIEI